MKKRNILILVSVIAAAALIAGAAGTFLYLRSLRNRDPVGNTIRAVFPSIAYYLDNPDEMKSLRTSLEASISSDVSEKFKSKPLEVSFESYRDDTGSAAGISAGFGSEKVSASLYADRDKIIAGSDRLAGGSYAVYSENIRDTLGKSVLAPGSGTSFELEQENFDNLCRIYETVFKFIEDYSYDEYRKQADESVAKLKEQLEITESSGTVSSLGKDIKAKFYTFETKDGFMDAIVDSFKESSYTKGLQSLADGFSSLTESQDDPETLAQVIDEMFEGLDAGLSGRIAVKGGFMVFAEFELKIAADETEETATFKFTAEFPERPDKDPRVLLTLKGSSDDSDDYISLTVDTALAGKKRSLSLKADGFEEPEESPDGEKSGAAFSLELNLEYNLQADWTAGGIIKTASAEGSAKPDTGKPDAEFTFSASGTYKWDKGSETATLSSLCLTSKEADEGKSEDIIRIDRSIFTLSLETGLNSIPGSLEPAENPKELFKLTENDIRKLTEDVEKNFESVCRAMNDASGEQVFVRSLDVGLVSYAPLDDSSDMFFADDGTGTFFLRFTETPDYLLAVDGHTMQPKTNLRFPGEIIAADADDGIVAVSTIEPWESKDKPNVNVYIIDAQTMQLKQKINMESVVSGTLQDSEAVSGLAIDGDYLTVKVSAWTHPPVIINLKTGEKRIISDFGTNIWGSCRIQVNRDAHVAMLYDNSAVCFISSQTGKTIASWKDSNLNFGNPFFDGRFLHIGEKYYNASGEGNYLLKTKIPHKYNLKEIVYVCDDFHVTYELINGEQYTVFYSADGQPCVNPIGGAVSSVKKLSGSEYIMLVFDYGTQKYYFETVTVKNAFTLFN